MSALYGRLNPIIQPLVHRVVDHSATISGGGSIPQEYDVFGTSDAQDFSYEYDPAAATATTEVDPSNGEGR